MEPFALVNQAVDLLAVHLPAATEFAAHVGEDAVAHAVYELIAKKLRDGGKAEAVTEFVAHPDDRAEVKRLLREAVREDPEFAAELARAVAGTGSTTIQQTGNVVGRDLIGRDSIHTTNSSTTNSTRKSSNAGLVGVGLAVVLAAILLVGAIGKSLLGAVESAGLSGKSTCADFLRSADPQAQAGAMKKIYLDQNKPHLAADPFIIQNTEYYCGSSTTMTLDHLAAQRHDE